MKLVNVHEAKTHLSRLLDEAEAGEEIVIARNGKPAVKLSPVGRDEPGVIGLLKGVISYPEDFDQPLPDEFIDLFEGKNS